MESWELRTRFDSGVCNAVAFSLLDPILATANDVSGVALWWEPSAGAVLHRFRGHGVGLVAFNAEGAMFATGSAAGTIMLWEIPGGRLLRKLDGHAEQVLAVAFHPGGEILASASLGCTIRMWDVATGNTVSILEGHTGRVQSLSFSRDGRVLASKSGDGTVRLWETESGKCRAVLPALASKDWMPSIAFHPHLPILAAVGSGAEPSAMVDSVGHLWELDIDRLLAHSATPASPTRR